MDLLLLLKLVHVLGAVVWVGGAAVLTLVVVLLDRRGDDRTTLASIAQLAEIGAKVFSPTGALTVLTGLTLAWLGGWGLAAWTVLAFGVALCTFALGAMVLGPTSGRCARIWLESGEVQPAMTLGRRVLRLLKLDLAAQFAIVSLMVLKPGWTDPLLLVPAALLALGALGYLRGAPAPASAQPA